MRTQLLAHKTSFLATSLLLFICMRGSHLYPDTGDDSPLVIEKQGSFAVGGKVIRSHGRFNPEKWNSKGQTYHGDHAYVFYQIPVNARKYPLVFLHGASQSSKTWETTPDGREGFQNIFLRRRYPVYLLDQPRRGVAGRSTEPVTIDPVPEEQYLFNIFRLGIWPHFFKNAQFSRKREALNQFFRQSTPNTGPYDPDLISDSIAELFRMIGPGVLVTHSQGGGPGWLSAMKSKNIQAVVSYEPSSGYYFPKGEEPETMESSSGPMSPATISMKEFLKLTKIPIILYFGDNIPHKYSPHRGIDNWRVRLEMARLWVAAINKHGGHATVIHLPELGIRGNTHFPFSDLNNLTIADLLSEYLQKEGLD